MTVVQNTAVFSEDNPDSSHPHCNTSFPSPWLQDLGSGQLALQRHKKLEGELSTTTSAYKVQIVLQVRLFSSQTSH